VSRQPPESGYGGASDVVVLSGREVLQALPLERCIEAVAEALVAHHRKEGLTYPVVREQLPTGGGIFGVKSGYLLEADALGLKAGGFWAENRERSLPTHQAAMLLFNPATGELRAVLDANVITVIRTAAAGALAAQALAPTKSSLAALIGAGSQAVAQTHALAWARPDLAMVKVFARSPESFDRYRISVANLGLEVKRAPTIREAVAEADIIVTATPSWEPLVENSWVAPGAHISAIGADTRGKQELDPELFIGARVVVDDWKQAITIGECQHAHRLGHLSRKTIHGELGAICAGDLPGREDDDTLTLFDSTGIALQDLAAAAAALEAAAELGLGLRRRLGDVTPEEMW